MSDLTIPGENANWDDIIKFLEPEPPKYCPEAPTIKQKAFLRTEAFEALFGGGAGGGKCLRCPDRAHPWYNENMESKVLTPTGFKLIGDINVGDAVCNPDGSIAKVVKVSDNGEKQFYRVTTIDGASVEVSDDHIWAIWKSGRRKMNKQPVPRIDQNLSERDEWNLRLSQRTSLVSTETLKAMVDEASKRSDQGGRAYHINIPLPSPLKMTTPKGKWPVFPSYTIGVLLGDGTITGTGNSSFYSADLEIFEMVQKELDESFPGIRLSPQKEQPGKQGRSYNFIGKSEGKAANDILRRDGLIGTYSHTKFIPNRIKNGPVSERWAVIQGLFDTDGHMDGRGHVEYVSVSKQLALDVQYILRSLGFRATISEKTPTYEYNGEKLNGKLAYRIYVQGKNKENLFRLQRKREQILPWNGQDGEDATLPGTRVISVEKTVVDNARCITVSNPNALFITDDFIVTHNSSALLMAALQWVHVPGYSAMIFRNTFRDLALPNAIMDRAKMWFSQYPDIKWSEKDYRATFPSGATLTFGYLENASDHFSYQGMEAQFVGFDEVTQIREEHYNYLLGRLRKPDIKTGRELAKVPLRARAACNPAPNWVRRYFLEEGPSHGRIFVPSLLADNPYLDSSYRLSLERLSPVLRAQWEFGDWYAEETGIMFDRDDFRTIGPNEVPEFDSRSIVRFWDLAATKPSRLNPDPDWTVGVKAGMKDGYMFILDVVRFRDSSDVVERRILETAHQDGADVKIRFDQDPGQAGKAMISHYGRNVLLGFDFAGVPIPRDKVARVNLWAPKAKRGEILLVRGDWPGDFIEEALSFGPQSTAVHDDQMDAVSGAFETLTGIHLKKRGTVRLLV